MKISFKYITAAAMALITSVVAAPTAQHGGGNAFAGKFGGDPFGHIEPQFGGAPGRYWYIHNANITWPTHTLQIVSNVTQDMPGWNPDWAPHGPHVVNAAAPVSKVKGVAPAWGDGIFGHVFNNCPKTIYVHTAMGNNDGKDPQTGQPDGSAVCNINAVDDPVGGTYSIAPGATYTTSMQVCVNGHSGVSIKISYDQNQFHGNHYQLEYSQKPNGNGNMAVWFDLSHEDGDPFINANRFAQVGRDGSGCDGNDHSAGGVHENLFNPAGSAAVNWPGHDKECEKVVDINIWAC